MSSRWLTADRIVGIVLLAVSIFFMLQALQLVNDITPIFRDQPAPDTMPKIIGLVAIIASLVTIFMPSTATKAVKDPQLQAAQAQAKKRASVLPISATTRLASLPRWLRSLSVYALVLRPFGFIPATAAFLFLASFLLGERRWWTMLLVATLTLGLSGCW